MAEVIFLKYAHFHFLPVCSKLNFTMNMIKLGPPYTAEGHDD